MPDLEQRLTGMETRIEAKMEQILALVVDVKESLERQIGGVEREMRTGFDAINVRFDNQAARLERHAALLQTGSRWVNRMNKWAEKVDAALDVKDRQIAELREAKDREIAELRRRVENLEQRNT